MIGERAFTMTMTKTLVVARRELAGYFFSPVAYVIGAVFLAGSAFVFFFGLDLFGIPLFSAVLKRGNEATLRPLFEAMAYIMVFAAPLLTMRLMADEFQSGTIETLMTAPITDTEVILGKFLGVLGFYAALVATTLVFLAVMLPFGKADAGVAVTGYLGMLLLGAAFLSVGLLASTTTNYQIIAAIIGVAILAIFSMLMQLVVTHTGAPLNAVAAKLNVMTYFKDFSRGMLDVRGLAFFISATALFLFLSVKTLESRRWR